MKRLLSFLVCFSLLTFPMQVFALQYTFEHEVYEFDDEEYWSDGWCYRPTDEVKKEAMLITYDENIINGDELIIPKVIEGYKITEFADNIFRWSTFKSCDLSAFPKLSNRMFEGSSLEKVILSDETKKIPNGCFLDCPIEEIVLPEGVKVIDDYAFRGTKIKELVFPSTVKELGFQVVSYCPELKKIEFKNGILSGFAQDSLSLGATFMVDNLETLILPETITYIGEHEFMTAIPGRHGFAFIKYPDNLTVYGKSGSYAQKYAEQHSLKFVAVEEQQNVTSVDISKYTQSKTHRVYNVFDTDYGAVLYLQVVGAPHATGPYLALVRENGESINLSSGVASKTLFASPDHDDIKLSDDRKHLTFNVSFDERLEGKLPGTGEHTVLHEAGTYYYEADLEAGTCVQVNFKPADTVSTWAKPEVAKAMKLGFVPQEFKEKCKQNITREDFCELVYNLISLYSDKELPQANESASFGVADTSNKKLISLWSWGIIKGKGTFTREPVIMPDGVVKRYPEQALLAPNDFLTREEAAVIIIRMIDKFFPMGATNMNFEYSDAGNISDWAADSVQVISNMGIMKGVGNECFAPKDNYTAEQAIVTLLRCYERKSNE